MFVWCVGVAALIKPREEGGPLWNSTAGFFTAHSETPTQVFTDSLYGAMLAHHFLDGGYTVPADYLEKHLAYEWEQNQDLCVTCFVPPAPAPSTSAPACTHVQMQAVCTPSHVYEHRWLHREQGTSVFQGAPRRPRVVLPLHDGDRARPPASCIVWTGVLLCGVRCARRYGMRVLSSPIQEDSIWMNGPPTWTYLALARHLSKS